MPPPLRLEILDKHKMQTTSLWRSRAPALFLATIRRRSLPARVASSAGFAALAGATTQRGAAGDNFGPTPAAPGVVFIAGIALPFVDQTSLPAGFSAGPVAGAGSFLVAPANSQGQPPEGDLIPPAAGPLGGLSAADVAQILNNAEATANTR